MKYQEPTWVVDQQLGPHPRQLMFPDGALHHPGAYNGRSHLHCAKRPCPGPGERVKMGTECEWNPAFHPSLRPLFQGSSTPALVPNPGN